MLERGRLVRTFARSKNGKRQFFIQVVGTGGASAIFRFA